MIGSSTLDVVAVISNPCRYQSRYRLYRDFEAHVKAAGARLTTVELAFGDREHSLTCTSDPRHIQVRTSHELWHKENMINVGISRLPQDWKYVAWIDADITFTRPDWVKETIEQLQHFHVVQMFSHAHDMGPHHECIGSHTGFAFSHIHRRPFGKEYTFWHPGYAWAARRSFIERCGGLMDWTLLGAGDHIMACAIVGRPLPVHGHVQRDCPNFMRLAQAWQQHASTVQGNIGYVPGTILHHFHGAKKNRRYVERWEILRDHKYDPLTDIKRDWQGIWQLSGNKPGLRDDLRTYFRMRNEDSIDV